MPGRDLQGFFSRSSALVLDFAIGDHDITSKNEFILSRVTSFIPAETGEAAKGAVPRQLEQ
jgi:hypothetical protein